MKRWIISHFVLSFKIVSHFLCENLYFVHLFCKWESFVTDLVRGFAKAKGSVWGKLLYEDSFVIKIGVDNGIRVTEVQGIQILHWLFLRKFRANAKRETALLYSLSLGPFLAQPKLYYECNNRENSLIE